MCAFTMSQAQDKVDNDQQRTIRLRNNKRRHRQRKKEYLGELEQRLAEARSLGIQATKEVQIASQRVVWENLRLRQILRDQGLDNNAINSLIYKDGPFTPNAAPPLALKTATQTAIAHHEAHEIPKAVHESIQCGQTAAPTDSASSSNSNTSPPQKTHPEKMSPDTAPAPCKILTLFAGNPSIDITQMPAVVAEKTACKETDGVECSQARDMLMRFATTEEKLDVVAGALEEGCVKNRSGGGCHVKNDVLWKTLDHICD